MELTSFWVVLGYGAFAFGGGVLFAYSKLTRTVYNVCIARPVEEMVERFVSELQDALDAQYDEPLRNKYILIKQRISVLRIGLKDEDGKQMPEEWRAWSIKKIDDLTKELERIEEALGYMVGEQFEQARQERVAAMMSNLFRDKTAEEFAEEVKQHSTAYQKWAREHMLPHLATAKDLN